MFYTNIFIYCLQNCSTVNLLRSTIKLEEELEQIIEDAQELNENNSSPVNVLEDQEAHVNMDAESNIPSSHTESCCVCSGEAGGAHKCFDCGEIVHAICGVGKEGYGSEVHCQICINKSNISDQQNKAFDGLQRQAKSMLDLSDKQLSSLEVGTSVTVPIPSVDRGKEDPKNVKGVILEKSGGKYKIGTKKGIINSMKYSRNQLKPCQTSHVTAEDVPDDIISL